MQQAHKSRSLPRIELPDSLRGLNCWDDVYILTNILLSRPDIRITTEVAVAYRYTVEKGSDSLTHSDAGEILADRIRCAGEVIKLIDDKGLTDKLLPFVGQLKLRAKVKYLRGKQLNASKWKKILPMTATEILASPCLPLPYRLAMALIQTLLPA